MADSTEKVARDLLVAWAQGLGLTPAPTVRGEAPAPGELAGLPTLSIWFQTTQHDEGQPEEVQDEDATRAIYDLGEMRARTVFQFRSGSYATAETYREAFRRKAAIASMRSNDGGRNVLKLSTTYEGIACEVNVYWDQAAHLVGPDFSEAQTVNLWEVFFAADVTFPYLVREDAPGTGTMLLQFQVEDDPVTDVATVLTNREE